MAGVVPLSGKSGRKQWTLHGKFKLQNKISSYLVAFRQPRVIMRYNRRISDFLLCTLRFVLIVFFYYFSFTPLEQNKPVSLEFSFRTLILSEIVGLFRLNCSDQGQGRINNAYKNDGIKFFYRVEKFLSLKIL